MNKKLAIPILFLVGFLLAVYFALPRYVEFKKIRSEIAERKLKLSEKQNYLKKLKDFSDRLLGKQEILNKIDSALPDKMSFASLLVFFQEKTLENGLVLKSFNQADNPQRKTKRESEEKPSAPAIKPFFIGLGLEGTLPAFENFLLALEKSSRMIEVENVSVEQSKGEAKSILDFYLLVKVYSY